jgi:lysozyme
MKLNNAGIDLIKKSEGIKLTSYQDSVGVWTIGYGNTYYEDGSKVGPGQTITQAEADKLFDTVVNSFATQVEPWLNNKLNDNQFSALVSFAYNLGMSNFSNSTLLVKVNANPEDATIRDEFMKWVNAGGQMLDGLVTRRQAEADLYFTPILKEIPVFLYAILIALVIVIVIAMTKPKALRLTMGAITNLTKMIKT